MDSLFALNALSLFNTILVLWLGFNLLRRVWWIGLILLAGAAFFISQMVMPVPEKTRWLLLTIAPFAWYLATLWYSGFWTHPRPWLYLRHRLWFALLSIGLVIVLVTNPHPFSIPAFMALCAILSIDVLRNPAPAKRAVNELARQRSRSWLLGIAGSVLVTSGVCLIALMNDTPHFNLMLWLLCALMILMLGQAVMAYEGGKHPRYWRNIVFIGGVYSVIVGWNLATDSRPIFSLLLTMFLMVAFYALYGWRSSLEQEQFAARLRPFITSQNLTSHILGTENDTRARASEMFAAICRDVLGTERAQLTPMGILGPLAGSGLTYPAVQDEINEFPPSYQWAIPLWAERGLIGTLLIGNKSGGGLYSQAEIEIAQTSGERIIDMLAGEQVARRLVQMERNRLSENRVTDLHTRRVLHDEILPLLHSVVLQLSPLASQQPTVKDAIANLTDIHRQIANLIHIPRSFANRGECDLQETLKSLFDTEFMNKFTAVSWNITGSPVVDMLVCDVVVGAVRETLRNAAVHGRGEQPDRPLSLTITMDSASIIIADDGIGLTPNMSSHNGHGLSLHSTLLAVVGGSMTVESHVTGGTQVTIDLPMQPATMPN